jgi:hypothetical protein
MAWYLTVYCIGAVLPVLAVVVADGWRSGAARAEPSMDPEELRAAVLVGMIWPMFLAVVVVLAVAWLAGRAAIR